MLKDKVYKYYVEQGMNCAEAMLLGANEEYGLGLSPESAKLIGGFGGGMGRRKTCGACSIS